MGGLLANGILPIFYLRMRGFYHIVVSCLLMLIGHTAMADIGETYDLKQQRNTLVAELERLTSDSVVPNAQAQTRIEELTKEILALDASIFSSYDETVSRMAAQKLEKKDSGRTAALLALVLSFGFLFLLALTYTARSRIQQGGANGFRQVYRELTSDFFQRVSPEKPFSVRLIKVNVVVVIGLVMMSVSVIAYLLTAL